MGGGGGGGVIKTENGRDRLHRAQHAGQAGGEGREWAFLEEDKKSVCGPPFAHRSAGAVK